MSAIGNLYGAPPDDLVQRLPGAAQFSPLKPGAKTLEETPPGSLDAIALLAPPGVIERRYALALALQALAPNAPLIALAQKDKGGARLAGDFAYFGCAFQESARRRHRICVASGPYNQSAVETAISEGALRFVEEMDLWTQPGVFSWNRLDPGSALLLAHLPLLAGEGADFGCGLGVLARAVLQSPKVKALTLIDIDRRAINAARKNIEDARANFLWADAREELALPPLDFIVMNPPFHESGQENQALGQTFIQSAAANLRKGGALWLTANRHLPYEKILKRLFRAVNPVTQEGGYKIYEARK